jgi:hypothetical protein
MRLPTHRDLYDVTDSSCVSIKFQSRVFRFYFTDGASGRHSMFSQIFQIILCIGVQGLGLLASFVA